MSQVLYNYVEEVDPNLTCAICQSALVDPVTTTSCKHTFCRDCIARALKHNSSCPIDRSALTPSSLQDTEPLVQLMLDELKVRCEAQGCGKVMQRGLLLSHLKSCTEAIVTCGDDQCGISMARNRLPHHRAYECFHRRMECKRCSVVVTFKEAKDDRHFGCQGPSAQSRSNSGDVCEFCEDQLTTASGLHRWTCPGAPVPCTHSSRGCTAIVPRSTLEKHLEGCPFEALGAFFAANDARFTALEKKQEELVAENDSLRSQLWNLRRGMVIPRGLWGQDYAAAGIDWPSVEPEHTPSPRSPSGPMRTSSVTIPGREGIETDPDATPTAANNFPHHPEDGISVTTTVATSSSPPSPPPPLPSVVSPRPVQAQAAPFGPPPHMPYIDWVLQRLPSPRMYGSEECAALCTSVIHLAAGLDAAERRSEIRTMTESLRIQEEVATLRAIVRPMRMQVLSRSRFPYPTPSVDILTPPLSNHSHGDTSDADDDDEHLASLSIRESVVFSAQDIHPRSSRSSLVATATAATTSSGHLPPRPQWTGRPCAFPPPSPEPDTSRQSRLGSIGARLGASILGIQRDAAPRL